MVLKSTFHIYISHFLFMTFAAADRFWEKRSWQFSTHSTSAMLLWGRVELYNSWRDFLMVWIKNNSVAFWKIIIFMELPCFFLLPFTAVQYEKKIYQRIKFLLLVPERRPDNHLQCKTLENWFLLWFDAVMAFELTDLSVFAGILFRFCGNFIQNVEIDIKIDNKSIKLKKKKFNIYTTARYRNLRFLLCSHNIVNKISSYHSSVKVSNQIYFA